VIDPVVWTEEQLEADRLESIKEFSRRRLEEPLEIYLEAFDEYQERIEELLETTVDLGEVDTRLVDVLSNRRLQEVFRYLAAPPISADDLKVLAEANSLSPGKLKSDPELQQRILAVVRQALDRRRFAWVSEQREPSESERYAAVVASASLMAASRTQTSRRNFGKSEQEALVKAALTASGFSEVASRPIPNISSAPSPGEFCGECVLGNRKGDVIVRLWDNRVMPIECKVSNSSTNSIKRLNNDAAVKAVSWRQDFGVLHVVPTAVLSGVYNTHNLVDAQQRGLALFWAHRLDALTDWIAATKQ
jgi:hypothetical protein